MSTMIMDLSIPRNPANYFCTFNRKLTSKLWRVSSINPKAATGRKPFSLQCVVKPYNDQISSTRRSGNYNPPLWDFDYIQSVRSEYKGDRYLERASELVLQVKILLERETEAVRRLELIDSLQKLGISYHFEDKINQILNDICHDQQKCRDNYEVVEERDLYSIALEFRLLRQHGFNVSQDVFNCFKNEKGDFKPSLGGDMKGLLQLYEASFLLTQGEETLELAREFSTDLLQEKLDHGIDDHNLSLMVRHALELPLHWRNQRLNARWFIDAYGCEPDMNPIIFELAKLDFNILQATYQEELKQVSRWWEQTRLAEKLPFARDRLVECYLWAVGELFHPEYGYARTTNTKINVLITVIDDMFDVYGTLEELQVFNDIIQRWDIEAMDQLPHYMQMCFLAVNNVIEEIAYEVLKEQEFDLVIPYLRKSWADLCRAYIKEAKWYSAGYTPTIGEYLDNAWVSVGPPMMLCHEFFLVTNPIKKEAVESLYKYHSIIQCSSMIVRLANDLGTSTDEIERGDVPKSIQCYMKETGADREEARDYVKYLIRETWKKMNKERIADSPFSQVYVRSAVDLGRFAQYMYQHGDGHGVQTPEIKHRISSVLFEPIL